MTRPLDLFISELLEYHGSALERDGEAMGAIMPEPLRSVLGLPEYVKIVFSPDAAGDSVSAAFGTEFFREISKLVGKSGCYSEVFLPAPPLKADNFEKKACKNIVLNNAVFEVEKLWTGSTSYLLSYYKYHAVSEENRDGVTAVLINERSLSATSYRGEIDALIAEAPPNENQLYNGAPADRLDEKVVLEALWSVHSKIIMEELKEFISSLERRLNNDLRRVNEYYGKLVKEIKSKIRAKNLQGEEKEKSLGKIKTVETELKIKERDLIEKYSLGISTEPLSFIRFTANTQVLSVRIKRRKASRLFHLAYNPVLKSPDPLPCEACFKTDSSHYICDDKLHILCNDCFSACPVCGKQYCRACHKSGCPRCNK